MDGARLYSMLPSARKRGNGHEMEHWRFQESLFYYVGEIEETPTLEILKTIWT